MVAWSLARGVIVRGFVPALLLSSHVAAQQLTQVLPEGVPQQHALARWERFQGSVQMDQASLSYELYVNPARPGMYEITHYRVSRSVPSDDGEPASAEKVIWNGHPPSEPLEAWELVDGRWQPLAHGTEAYRHEMRVAMRLYAMHHAAEMVAAER